MAASGSISVLLKSVDYTGALPSGTCYNAGNAGSFGRGRYSLTTTVNWSIDNSNVLRFTNGGSTGSSSWYVCSANGYNMEIQFSTNQTTWTTIASSRITGYDDCSDPARRIFVDTLDDRLIAGLAPVQLSQNGYIRMYTWTQNACPTSDYANAYPNQSAGQAVAVPIYIEVSWDAYLRYNGNGGEGVPSTQHTKVTEADSTTFTIPSDIPTYTWHRFKGYSFNRSASTGTYQPGDSVTISKNDPDKTLYAIWEEYYRPGEILVDGAWKSHMADGGSCHKRVNGQWVEMRTIGGAEETDDSPVIRVDGEWVNQQRIGDES